MLLSGATATHWGYTYGQRQLLYGATGATAKGNISGWSGSQLHSEATSAGNVEESGEIAFFRRNVHIGHFGGKCRNFSSRSEEAGVRRLGLQPHTGVTSAGNVKESGESAFFRRNVHVGHFGGKCRNFSSRSEEAGVRRLGPQTHTGATSAGNVEESGKFSFFRRNVHIGHFGEKCREISSSQRRLE